MLDKKVGAALVVGGGIAGMQESVDLAESGIKVYLVDKNPAIGGAMAQLDKTFPTNDCAMCTLAPRMVDCGRHINIEKLSYSQVVNFGGAPGRFHVQIRKKARSIDPEKCTGCEECAQNCLVRYKVYSPEEVAEPELAPEDRLKVEDIINHHRSKVAPLIGVLQDINEEFPYLRAEVLRYVSRNLDYLVTSTGCLGLCQKEPLVDVIRPGWPRIVYAEMNAEKGREIVAALADGQVVPQYILCKIEEEANLVEDSVRKYPVNTLVEGIKRVPKYEDVPFFSGQEKRILRNCGLISPDKTI